MLFNIVFEVYRSSLLVNRWVRTMSPCGHNIRSPQEGEGRGGGRRYFIGSIDSKGVGAYNGGTVKKMMVQRGKGPFVS